MIDIFFTCKAHCLCWESSCHQEQLHMSTLSHSAALLEQLGGWVLFITVLRPHTEEERHSAGLTIFGEEVDDCVSLAVAVEVSQLGAAIDCHIVYAETPLAAAAGVQHRALWGNEMCVFQMNWLRQFFVVKTAPSCELLQSCLCFIISMHLQILLVVTVDV